MCGSSASGTPGPWSRTVSAPPRSVTSTRPPSGEYFAALSSRLLTARPSRSGIPSTADGSSSAANVDVRRVPARALHRLADERVEPHVLQLLGGLVAARELDQVRDERGELLGLLDDVVEHARGGRRQGPRAAARRWCAAR